MDFVTIASAANATDFGNLTTAVSQAAGFASTTRGITSGDMKPLLPQMLCNLLR